MIVNLSDHIYSWLKDLGSNIYKLACSDKMAEYFLRRLMEGKYIDRSSPAVIVLRDHDVERHEFNGFAKKLREKKRMQQLEKETDWRQSVARKKPPEEDWQIGRE